MANPLWTSWEQFRASHDLLEASHRGLQRQLIPAWLNDPRTLSARIESSAYGETPGPLVEEILDALAVRAGVVFVDLGCGAGNVCAAALSRGASVLGIERNPQLIAAARAFLSPAPDHLELRHADFLETPWQHADVAYTTSARFPPAVLGSLSSQVTRSPRLRAIACLGRSLTLDSSWIQHHRGPVEVCWNPREAVLSEPLFLYRRSTLPG